MNTDGMGEVVEISRLGGGEVNEKGVVVLEREEEYNRSE